MAHPGVLTAEANLLNVNPTTESTTSRDQILGHTKRGDAHRLVPEVEVMDANIKMKLIGNIGPLVQSNMAENLIIWIWQKI